MTVKDLPKIFRLLKRVYLRYKTPYVTELAARRRKDPFKVLISCVLSLRTKDEVTREASERLFKRADTPETLARLTPAEVERLIYPAGFYRVKAVNIIDISRRITEEHGGRTPDTIEKLLQLKGVGRKTANLVVTMGFGRPGICVDTHVHRITNRWGLVSTASPDETETELRKVLQRRYWIPINDLLVAYGQNLCRPVSPFCSACAMSAYCAKKGVKTRR